MDRAEFDRVKTDPNLTDDDGKDVLYRHMADQGRPSTNAEVTEALVAKRLDDYRDDLRGKVEALWLNSGTYTEAIADVLALVDGSKR